MGPKGEVWGNKEEYEAPYVKTTVNITPDIDIENDILNVVDAEVTVTRPDGSLFILTGADYSGDGNWTSGEGTMPLEFEGEVGDWI